MERGDFSNGTVAKERQTKRTVKSREFAEKLFPAEKWEVVSASSETAVFISDSRRKDGRKDPAVYDSDKMMALTLAEKSGETVFMIPERNAGKNPDCIFDGGYLEMKHVRGGQRKVGKNAINALSQAENVFLYVDKTFSIEECLSSVKGYYSNQKRQSLTDGACFKEPKKDSLLYIFVEGKLYKYTWGDVV